MTEIVLYEEGNSCFKSGDFDLAIEHYSSALKAISCSSDLIVKLLLNRSQCYLKVRNYDLAVVDCTKVIKITSANNAGLLKALIRRATAYEYLGEFSKAMADAEATLQMDIPPSLLVTVQAMMPRLRGLIRRDLSVSVSEGRPNSMVTSHQTLRLVFTSPPPNTLVIDEVFSVKLCIGNEFGLWNRSLMEGVSNDNPVLLFCELIHVQLDPNKNSDALHLAFKESYDRRNGSELSVVVGADGKASLDLKFAQSTEGSTLSMTMVVLKLSLNRPLPSGVEVVPVLSLPIKVTTTGAVQPEDSVAAIVDGTLSLCEQQHAYCIRDVRINDSHFVYALESPGFLGIGGKVWDSTYILLKYLAETQKEYVHGRRIVELGSGTGLAGIGLCSLGPESVVLTDMTEVAPLLAANIQLNSVLLDDDHLKEVLALRYEAQAHNWGSPLDNAAAAAAAVGGYASGGGDDDASAHSLRASTRSLLDCDVVVASDVVYDPSAYQPLIDTLFRILEPRLRLGSEDEASSMVHPVCILAHRHRHPEDQRFFDMLAANESISTERIEYQQQTEAADGSSAERSTLSDVILFKIQYK